jgi:CDP-diacylglycerol---serine O-phosphatidyltransferase
MHPKIAVAIPNAATFCSLTLGVISIILLNEQRFLLAALMIGLASICDGLDGELAKRLNSTTDMGKELDSLADLVTFGVAPAMLTYNLLVLVGVERLAAIPVALVFVWAGAFRLARYNTLPSSRLAHFIGLPIPAASYLLVTGAFWQSWTAPIWWTTAVVSASILMVSAFPYPKMVHLLRWPPLMWAAALAAALGVWLMAGWQAVPFGMLALYAAYGPAYWIYLRIRRRTLMKPEQA